MSIKKLSACGLMAAVTVVLSQIAVPLPISPVPISLGVLAVFLCGALLTPGAAIFTQITYLLMGAVGLPVFAGFKGGVGALLGPTGGFLAAYPFMALIVSFAANHAQSRRYAMRTGILVSGMLLTFIPLYGLGSAWFAISQGTSFLAAVQVCVLPFIVPDLLKVGVCATLLPVLQARLRPALASAKA